MPGEQMTHHIFCVAPAFTLPRPPWVHHGRNSKCEARSCPITVFEWLWHALRLPGAPSVNHGGTPNMRSNYVPRHGFSKDIAVTQSARTTIGTPRETLKMLSGQIPPLSFGVALAFTPSAKSTIGTPRETLTMLSTQMPPHRLCSSGLSSICQSHHRYTTGDAQNAVR